MIKALQSSAQAMSIQRQRHELIANNLANVNTPGFKRLIARVRELPAAGGGAPDPTRSATGGSSGGLTIESHSRSGNGPLESTGNPLDLALVGEGFFLIDTPQGPRLTRDGGFGLDANGELIHGSGHSVLAGGSPVQIQDVASVLPDGSILDGDRLVGRLSVVKPMPDARLVREGDNLIHAEGGYEELSTEEVTVVAGHVEGSNVEAVTEMVEMIRAFRAYEVAQKAVQAADDTLRIAVQRVGVLRA